MVWLVWVGAVGSELKGQGEGEGRKHKETQRNHWSDSIFSTLTAVMISQTYPNIQIVLFNYVRFTVCQIHFNKTICFVLFCFVTTTPKPGTSENAPSLEMKSLKKATMAFGKWPIV